jgi:hypothetical protein
MEDKGLLHKTQAYGIRSDIIRTSGTADIPEAEQLAGSNTEAFLKLISSGAHLYNRPLISQESFVFWAMSETTSPQKLKLLIDKSFAAGINQIEYHGTPYKYQTGEYGNEGWRPFSNPFEPGNNFSEAFNESSPFWEDIKYVNQYIARSQYILQSGKPASEVLIYFPFIDFMPEQVAPNPKEILVQGRWASVEPNIPLGIPKIPEHKDIIREWFTQIWPLINQLEKEGITWEFTNSHSLETSEVKNGKIIIRGNEYCALILANLPYIEIKSAEKVAELSKNDVNLLYYGDLPTKQPSFLNFEGNDKRIQKLIQASILEGHVSNIKDLNRSQIDEWANKLSVPIKFLNSDNLIKSTNRRFSDGSLVKFFWNSSEFVQDLSVSIAPDFKYVYWLNAETGDLINPNRKNLEFKLDSFGTVFMIATNRKLPEKSVPANTKKTNKQELIKLDSWNIEVPDTTIQNTHLFDWRSNNVLKYSSDIASYTAIFELKEFDKNRKYLLDLGSVYWTAEIFVNGSRAGKRIWMPYQFDISPFLKKGKNELKVKIVPTLRNRFIGEAANKNPLYPQFIGKENTLMPAGLLGPVKIDTAY